MTHLKRLDTLDNIQLINVQEDTFSVDYPEVSIDDALNKLHGYLTEGNAGTMQLITGLDVTYHAWRLVGKGHWIAPLRWPVIRFIADRAYLFFAKHRYSISYWLTGKRRCYDCRL